MGCSSCAKAAAARAARLTQSKAVGRSVSSGTDLHASLSSIPTIGKSEPVILNWKNRPPSGGWGVTVSIGGTLETFDGPPRRIADRIYHAYSRAGRPVPLGRVWDFLNMTWTARDPSRAIRQEAVDQAARTIFRPNAHLDSSPATFGPRVWGMLSLFGMKGHFDKLAWLNSVAYVTRLLDPASNPAGCDECHLTFTSWRLENPPEKIEDEHQASRWIHELHNVVNKKLGKPVIPFEEAVRLNQWAFTLDTGTAVPA